MKNNLINSLVELSNVQITFNREQWLLYKDNELNLLQITIGNSLKFNCDLFLYRKYLRFSVALAIAFFMSTVEANATTTINSEAIDRLGQAFVSIVQQAGYWICFAKGLMDIIKEVMRGGDKAEGIGRIVVKYVLAFASFYLLPLGFDLIKNNFH